MAHEMKKTSYINGIKRCLSSFRRQEDGVVTVEFVIWMPIFAILIAMTMNLSMMFYHESQMLRVAQDATRALSLGRFDGDPDKSAEQLAEEYIQARLAFIGAAIKVDTRINPNNTFGVAVETTVSTDAQQLMPFNLMSGPFANVPVGVYTQYLIEY